MAFFILTVVQCLDWDERKEFDQTKIVHKLLELSLIIRTGKMGNIISVCFTFLFKINQFVLGILANT